MLASEFVQVGCLALSSMPIFAAAFIKMWLHALIINVHVGCMPVFLKALYKKMIKHV